MSQRYTTGYAPSSNRRSGGSRVGTFVLVVVALLLIGLAAGKHPVALKLRSGLLDIVSPAASWLSTPVSGARNMLHDKQRLMQAFEENKALRDEVDTLRRWQAVAQALKAENDALRTLAGYQPVEHARYISARVVGQSPGGFRASLMINAGSAKGVGELQPVIDSAGIIGRVIELADHSARVLLITDSNSRIPVVTADARVHAILTGTGEELMQLTFLGREPEKIAVGERVVTTEEAGLIPGGIMVGTVFKREGQRLYVKPVRPLTQSEYVRVVVASATPEEAPKAAAAE